jgi:hypothetical protein
MGDEPEEITLQEGSYSFICFSFNTSTMLPNAGNGSGADFTFAASTASEIYWQKQSVTLPLVDDVSFLLKPQFVKVKLKLDVTGGGRTFDDDPGSISLDAASSGSFNLKEGTFSSLSGTINFTAWHSDGLRVFNSDPITFLPKAVGEYTLTIPANALTFDDGSWPTVARSIFIPAEKFEKEKSYTLFITLKELATSKKFAGSNIFWDGSKLTFYPHGENDYTKYQGVYFKWGSLIGISPAGADESLFSSGTTANGGKDDGTPIYLKVNGVWVKTNVAYATAQGWFSGSGSGWSDIPYQDNTAINTTNTDAHSLLVNPDFEHYKGDICNYINPAYRMPTMDELEALGTGESGNGVYTGFTFSSYIEDQTADGQTALDQFGTFTGIFGTTYHLPVSGGRDTGAGVLRAVGFVGAHWSGSAYDSSGSYVLTFYSSEAVTNYVPSRDPGFPVRCVLN